MWYRQLKPLLEAKKIEVVGVIQELHAERCRLFQQWKQLDFPIVQDAINQNGIAVVPLMIALDEHGVVRQVRPSFKKFSEEFLPTQYEPSSEPVQPMAMETARVDGWSSVPQSGSEYDRRVGLADAQVLWKPSKASVQAAIENYEFVVKAFPARGDVHFRLGTALRRLYELQGQVDADLFAQAVQRWEQALQLDPNQYIWRRRIQQYGPRLKKPYSFYDWVAQAREEIKGRGEEAVELSVEPNGAELATRARKLVAEKAVDHPDPENKIILDEGRLVQTHFNLVPGTPAPGEVVAVHVGLTTTSIAKWNHETSPLEMYVEVPPGIKISSQRIVDLAEYASSESKRPISLSFEVQVPKEAKDPIELNGFALFNICEDVNDQCLFRRRNIKIRIPIRQSTDQ